MKTRPLRDQIRRHYQDAFTLVEAIMAVAVIAIMFVSLYLGISFSYGVTGVEPREFARHPGHFTTHGGNSAL